jgi:transposase
MLADATREVAGPVFTPCELCRDGVEALRSEIQRLKHELALSQAHCQQMQKERDRVSDINRKLFDQVRQHVPGLITSLRRYGEIDDPGQQVLVDLLMQAGGRIPASPAAPSPDAQPEPQPRKEPKPAKPDGRSTSKHARGGTMQWPQGAPEEQIHLPDPEIVVTDAQGRPLVRVGEVEVERLVHVEPAKVSIQVFTASVFAPRDDPADSLHAEVPQRLLPHVSITHGTVASLALWRYDLLLPIYRIEELMGQLAWTIARGTICRWLMSASPVAVAEAIHDEILTTPCVSFDDTPWWVLQPDRDANGKPSFEPRGEAHQARIFAVADANGTNIAYHYRHNKLGEHLRQLLGGYQGKVLVDDYRGYLAPLKELKLIYGNCWAHVRIKTDEAHDQTWGPILLGHIKDLFKAEENFRKESPDERLRHRQEICRPIVDAFFAECDRVQPLLAPKDPLAIAVSYAIRLKDGLKRFLDDPFIPLSNNGIERGFRPVAISRRNSLFSDTERGARTSAAWMTVIQSARRLGINVHQYLIWMMDHLAAGTKAPRELTPCAYQRHLGDQN